MRTIVEDDEVASVRDVFTKQYPRTEDAWQGLTWLVARNPQVGVTIGLGDDIRLHKQSGVNEDVPEITVLYNFDDQYVKIRMARFQVDAANDDQGLQEISA